MEANDINVIKILFKVIYLIDNKDNYTKKHSENVTKYSVLLVKN